jgi:hypothetical protein
MRRCEVLVMVFVGVCRGYNTALFWCSINGGRHTDYNGRLNLLSGFERCAGVCCVLWLHAAVLVGTSSLSEGVCALMAAGSG